MSRSIRQAWQNPQAQYYSRDFIQQKSDRMLRMNLAEEAHQRYSRTAGGKRADLDNQYYRSSWEANYARFLNWLQAQGEIISWEYEPHTFIFEAIKQGTRAYTPDFKVYFPKNYYEWHEVKGWMDPKSKTRLARMEKYYPNETIVLIDKAWFRQANRSGLAGLIPGWERPGH